MLQSDDALAKWKRPARKSCGPWKKAAVEEAGREARAAEDAWKKTDSKRKKVTHKRMEAEKKLRQAFKAFNDALTKLILP